MATRIETDFFLKRDIISVLEEHERSIDIGDELVNCVTSENYQNVTDDILEKVIEFVNENYTLKQ